MKELRALFGDFLDGKGDVSHEVSNGNSEAGIGFAKGKAVYPFFTHKRSRSTVLRAWLTRRLSAASSEPPRHCARITPKTSL
jgi:hypothetical protein